MCPTMTVPLLRHNSKVPKLEKPSNSSRKNFGKITKKN